MLPWVAILASVSAVSAPIVVGWWWSNRAHRRQLRALTQECLERELEHEALRARLNKVETYSRALARSLNPDKPEQDSLAAMGVVREALLERSRHLRVMRDKHKQLLSRLAREKQQVALLKPRLEARLAEDMDLQAHLAQLTHERDTLKSNLSALRQGRELKAAKLQIKAARMEAEELRFQLRMANQAIVTLEEQLRARRAPARAATPSSPSARSRTCWTNCTAEPRGPATRELRALSR